MEIRFTGDMLTALQKAGVKSPVLKTDRGYARTKDVDSRHIDPKDFAVIRRVASTEEFKSTLDGRRVLRKLSALEALAKGSKNAKVGTLEVLADAIREAVDGSPRRWIFLEGTDALLPYCVTSIRFHPASRGRGDYYSPARVQVTLKAISRGKEVEKKINFHRSDLPATVENALSGESALLSTDKLVEDFDVEAEKYVREAQRTGEQYLATGKGKVASGSEWSREEVSFDREGGPSKVVMDDSIERGSDSDVADMTFWAATPESDDEDGGSAEGEKGEPVLLPTHPVVRVFDLATHDYADVHVSCLEPYVYDAGLVQKLVLPAEHKELIDALTGSAIEHMSDIVRGKARGIIILCSGVPGTGKTLTAEVYGEAAERPLYVVQCSQLGTDEKDLEKHLAGVLERATRWRAILLIDEADVYIHERGDDIQQNAIVGVFLRLLEYYGGILFLTTNRVTVVDDAILSRTTAHVRYDLPEPNARPRLWRILLEQYGVQATPEMIDGAVGAFPNVSGRSIRQLVRLGLIVAKSRGQGLAVEHLVQAAKFHDFDGESRREK